MAVGHIIKKANDAIALKMTIAFGSIWCVYVFTVFSLIPLLEPKMQNTLLYISNCIQLIALPAIMVGSAILSRGTEARAADDHAALIEILDDVREELAALKRMTGTIAENTADPAPDAVQPYDYTGQASL